MESMSEHRRGAFASIGAAWASLLPLRFKCRTKLFLVCLGSLILVGCSTPRLIYSWMDWLIPRKFSHYVDLNYQQTKQLDMLIESELIWHRRSELPRYLHHLQQLRDDLEEPLTPQQVLAHFDRASGHWTRLVERLLPKLLPLIQSLSDRQVEQLLAVIEEDEDELHQKYHNKTPAERLKYALKRMKETTRPWVERLSLHQRKVIDQHIEQRDPIGTQWFAFRSDWIERLSLALEQRHDGQKLLYELKLLLLAPDRLKSDLHLKVLRQNRQQLAETLVDIHQSLSQRQKRFLRKKINKLSGDVQFFTIE